MLTYSFKLVVSFFIGQKRAKTYSTTSKSDFLVASSRFHLGDLPHPKLLCLTLTHFLSALQSYLRMLAPLQSIKGIDKTIETSLNAQTWYNILLHLETKENLRLFGRQPDGTNLLQTQPIGMLTNNFLLVVCILIGQIRAKTYSSERVAHFLLVSNHFHLGD